MADYSPSEIVDLIIEYGRSNENARECARQYALRYLDRRCPSHVTIISLINRAREGKLHRKRKKKSLTDDNNLNIAVLGMAVINPQISQRRISRELNTTSRSTRSSSEFLKRIIFMVIIFTYIRHSLQIKNAFNFVIGVWKNYRKI